MSIRYLKKELAPASRVICISDVHGSLKHLWGLFDKVRLTPADELIIVGDLLEKGPDSLAALRYVMKLSETHRVTLVCGNCDDWSPEIDAPTERTDAFIRHYMTTRFGSHGLLSQMCAEAGFTPNGDMDAMRSILKERFAKELDYLRSLPHIVETRDYLFVHGGLPEGDISALDGWSLMKNDDYMNHARVTDKWQIVGHTPCVLYHNDVTDANVIIDRAKRLISLDGGCILKDDGQLNALIIPHAGSEDFFTTYYDPFPVKRAASAQKPSGLSYYIRWGDDRVEVLERGEEFSRCRHVRTGYEMDILTDFLTERDGETHTNDCTDYVLPLEAGDELSVVRSTGRGHLCKKNGVSGWYYGEFQ